MKKINELYAWIAVNSGEGEGIIGVNLDGQWYPMVANELGLIEQWTEKAHDIQKQLGVPVKMVRFDNATILRDFTNEC